MGETRKLQAKDLRAVVKDEGELAKGAKVFDEGGLVHLSRFEHKLFADAKGSGASPYKVQILFEDAGIKGRCSCMAARSRPFCKHAAALLVAWSRAPESFAEAAAPPPGMAGDARKKEVKKGKVETKELMGRGVDQVSTLVRELAVAGVAALAADRVEQVRALGAALRESRLRRLSARTLDLSGHLARAAARSDTFDAPEYAELLGDMLLTARKLEKHLAGEPLADEHVEELIGKTWTKKDRKPIDGLDLCEYAFSTRWTPDDFVVRESRFVDLNTGDHYSEKQILPAFLAKRTDPKKSWGGQLLQGASGSLYPSFSPRRLDLEAPGSVTALTPSALARLIERAVPSVSSALAALQERRKDVFAPETLPLVLRADTVLADGARLQVVDEASAALFLPDEGDAADALADALRGCRLAALIGDIALDHALPTLFPIAAVTVDAKDQLALASLGRLDASAILESKKARTQALAAEQKRGARWVDVARQAGASGAAVALGEVREEMAHALSNGLSSVVPRFTDPLVARLRELSLGKQAELLATLATRQDAAEKLDDFVKLHQVLGIALARLAGASHVDRASIEPLPSHASVHVKRAERPLSPREVGALQRSGKINRYEAAMHHARHYASLPTEALATDIYPTWADGSAMPYVAAALARAPSAAVDAARRVLEPTLPASTKQQWWWVNRSTARVAKLTAIRVLASVATLEAKQLLWACMKRREQDPALAAHAERALARLADQKDPEARVQARVALEYRALNASNKDDRKEALAALANGAFVESIPIVRASFRGDVSSDVRSAAALSLAQLGDVDATDAFVRALRDRQGQPDDAKTAARALGALGDVRGIDELLSAWAEGWHPAVVAEAMREIGPASIDPIVQLLEERPELAERKAALGVIGAQPAADVAAVIIGRLEDHASAEDFCTRASLYVTMVSQHAEAAQRVVKRIVELRPAIVDKSKSTSEEKALAKKCAKHVKAG